MARSDSSFLIVPRKDVALFAGMDAGHTVVWLQGEHDISTEAALSETMARAIALDDADLVVDLSGVQFIGASTIGVIIRTRNVLRDQSRSLMLRSPPRCALLVLELCGLTDLLDPGPIEQTHVAGNVDALGTWVAVPATDRADQRADALSPRPVRTSNADSDPVTSDPVTRDASMVNARPANERTSSVAGRRKLDR